MLAASFVTRPTCVEAKDARLETSPALKVEVFHRAVVHRRGGRKDFETGVSPFLLLLLAMLEFLDRIIFSLVHCRSWLYSKN